MPTEIRHVLFTNEEAVVALREYCASSGRRFPSQVVAFALNGGDRPYVRLIGQAVANGGDTSISFSTKELIEPLLLYCKKKRIPLPARGAKDVTVVNNQLTLMVRLR